MPINPAIALGVKGIELQDPLAQYGKAMMIQSAQQENALAQRKMRQAEQEQEATNALNRAYAEAYNPKTGDVDINRLRQSMATGGYGSKIPSVEKSIYEGREARTKSEESSTKLLDAKLKQSRQFLETLDPNDPNAAQQYIAWHEGNHADPVIGSALSARGITADQARASIAQALQTPGGLARLINQSKLGVEKFMELNKPQLSTADLGGQVVSRTFEPVTGQLTTIGTQRKTMTPGEAQRINLDRQRLNLEGQRVEIAQREEQRKQQGLEGLAPKEVQKREAAFPQATSAIKGFEAKSELFIKDLQKLRDHPGLSQITGFIAGRASALTADGRAAQALYDKVVAKGGFQALQDMRDASKSGGALGSVSNQEGKQLIASFSAIDRRQDAKDVQAAIDQSIADVEGARTRMREAYDSTYSYKSPAGGVIDFGSLK